MEIARKSYPSDGSDEEWALIAQYLTLLPEGARQREYPLREATNGLRYIIKTGAQRGARCRMICRRERLRRSFLRVIAFGDAAVYQ
jgi:transposase